jgi:hypothetical protein
MRNLLVAIIGLSLLSGHSFSLAAQKVTTTAASITFADRTVGADGGPDRITSDGLGVYADGTDRVSCVLFSSTGDARLDTTLSMNPARLIDYDASQVISGTGPAASFVSTGTVDIQALAQMHVGDSKLTGAAFTTSIGQFHFLVNEGGSYVTATRLDPHTWTITTDDPYQIGAGDVAVLVQTVKNKSYKTGTYHMPFQLTVTCPTCIAPM